MSFLTYDNDEKLDIVIRANNKFTGHPGDEDSDAQPENNDEYLSYFVEQPDKAESIIAMEKVNGEAAHFSSRVIADKMFIIAGSKNVHILIANENDIDKYKGDRYRIAKIVARAVWKQLSMMQRDYTELLLSLLNHTKCTMVCEILIPGQQHITNISHINIPTLVLLCMTPAVMPEPKTLTLPPHHCLALATAMGFKCATFKNINKDDLSDFIKDARKEEEIEGYVLYYIRTDLNGHEQTIGLEKIKTIWYVMLRALREKTIYAFTKGRKKDNWDINHAISSTDARYKNIQTWLKFSNEYYDRWHDLATSFLKWFNLCVTLQDEEQFDFAKIIRSDWPIIWEQFLTRDTDKDNDV